MKFSIPMILGILSAGFTAASFWHGETAIGWIGLGITVFMAFLVLVEWRLS